ncbi:MAG: nitroreductase family protein [Chloroflexota bacterium]|nr:nitroreductase family protein [Chloroflexota bacterium]
MFNDLVRRNRCYRRFYEDVEISIDTLKELVDLARLSATGGNKQPLKFYLSCDPDRNSKIFPLLTWAGALPDWPGPSEGERPSAYIIILGDTEVSKSFGIDHGIAAQTILLGATEVGFGGCMLGSIRKDEAQKLLNVPSRYEILLTIALGKPKERVVIDTMKPGDDTKYWREKDSTHHVPKRSSEDILISE